MRYRVQSGRPVVHKAAAELDAVRCALRRRDGGFALAMTFDPGDAANLTLTAHAADLMLGLMHLRGWRHAGQEMRIATAADWTDRWWDRPLGPEAFVVESDLAPTGAADVADIDRIITLTMIAWCMERELYLHGRPVPDLMTACGPDGLALANIHPEPLLAAMRAERRSITERMATLAEPARSAAHAHVLMHLDGSAVRPWSLPDRPCAFATKSADPAVARVFVALEDTSADPRPETVRTLLRLMLASGTDD